MGASTNQQTNRLREGVDPGADQPVSGSGVTSGFQLELTVGLEGATDDEIAEISDELNAWIREAGPDCEVARVTVPGPAGARGLLTVLGTLGIKLLAPGALTALINCLAVYIKERRKTVKIKVQAVSGATVEIDAGGIGRGELELVLRQAGLLLGPSGALPHA
jgi:hypothetical protein